MPEATAKIWGQLGMGAIEKFPLADLRWGQLHLGTKLGKVEPVFPRADKSAIERMQKMEDQERSGPGPTPQTPTPPTTSPAAPSAAATPPDVRPAADAQSKENVGRRASSPGHPESGSAPQMPAQPTQQTPSRVSATPAAAPADTKITIDDFAKIELRVAQIKVAEKVKGADKLLRLEVDLGTETRQIVAGIAEAYAPETLIGRKVVIVANLAPRKLRGLESNGMIVAASLEGGKPVLAAFLEEVPVGARLK
jgi:methionyl-tRNA synthetase